MNYEEEERLMLAAMEEAEEGDLDDFISSMIPSMTKTVNKPKTYSLAFSPNSSKHIHDNWWKHDGQIWTANS